MAPQPANFATAGDSVSPPPRARTHFGFLGLCALLGLLIVGMAYLAASGASITRITNKPFLAQLKHLLVSRDRPLKGEPDDRINLLLLGMGGAGHEGAYLTDTIILWSFRPSMKQMALLSLPRDLAVKIPSAGIRKINHANAIGRELNYPGGGEQLTARVVSEITGLPIHYFARVDFEGFRRLIDDLGGIEIEVERAFTDRQYPTKNFGYQTVNFKAGQQRMNGDLALKFVRSRHGDNDEGSDFARARRQQKVLAALKDKLFSLSILISPSRLGRVLQTFGNHSRTNLEVWEMRRLASLVRKASPTTITRVLDATPDGLLRSEVGIDGAYLLVPQSGDFGEVETLARNLFQIEAIEREQALIAIDHDRRNQLAADALRESLTVFKAKVVRLPAGLGLQENGTVVYDLSQGMKPYTRQALASQYDLRALSSLAALETSRPLPTAVREFFRRQTIDFLIILGPPATASSTSVSPRSS